MSVITTRSCAWLMIQAICSGKRRGLTVWQMAPMPMMPYQTSRWRQVFQAMRGDAIAELDAVALQPLRDLQRALVDLGVVGAMDRSLDRSRYDLLLAVDTWPRVR